MRSTSRAALLAVPLLLAFCELAPAQPPPGYFPYGAGNGVSCLAPLTNRLHQHGPLYNYGPYYGYPPFEPYGPWNAYLQYNPWYYGVPYGNREVTGCFLGDLSGHGPLGWTPSWHSSWSCGGWFHGCSTCGHGGLFTGHYGWAHASSGGCSTCQGCGSPPAATPATPATPPATMPPMKTSTTDFQQRFVGAGDASDFRGYYQGIAPLDLQIVPAGGEEKSGN